MTLAALVLLAAGACGLAAGKIRAADSRQPVVIDQRLNVKALEAPGLQIDYASLPGCTDAEANGALHVSGNRVLTAAGKPFTFYGITIFGGLEDGGGNQTWESGVASGIAQIQAAARWRSNTVRIQVNEQNMFDHGDADDGVNLRFLAAVCDEVQLARRQGLETVISDQTEWPDWMEREPTPRTFAFWHVLGTVFGNQPGVSFDLYNEPRVYTRSGRFQSSHSTKLNIPWIWRLWRSGGSAGGIRYLGMQAVVDEIRDKLKLSNVIWLEGPFFDDALGLVSRYPIKGSGIVWSIHHPSLTGTAAWKSEFGYLAQKVPVVDGEWSQYASNRPECRPQAYRAAPRFLAYLRAHRIGLLGWSLQPGSLLADPSRLEPSNTTVPWDATRASELLTPSRLPRGYACSNADVGDGVGTLVRSYFRKFSRLAG